MSCAPAEWLKLVWARRRVLFSPTFLTHRVVPPVEDFCQSVGEAVGLRTVLGALTSQIRAPMIALLGLKSSISRSFRDIEELAFLTTSV